MLSMELGLRWIEVAVGAELRAGDPQRRRFGEGAAATGAAKKGWGGARLPELAPLFLAGVASATGAEVQPSPSSSSSSYCGHSVSALKFLTPPSLWRLVAADAEPGLAAFLYREVCGVMGSVLLPDCCATCMGADGAVGTRRSCDPELLAKLRTNSCCQRARLENSVTRRPMSFKASKESVDKDAATPNSSESHPCASTFSTTALRGCRPTTPTALEVMTTTWILSSTCAWARISWFVMGLPCAFA